MEYLNETQRKHYNALSPAGKMKFLRSLITGDGRDVFFGEAKAAVTRVLFDLEREEEQYHAIDLHSSVDPATYDVLISDISEDDLSVIGNELRVHRLDRAPAPRSVSPVTGIIFGLAHRTFVPLIVNKGQIAIHVLFLLNTGSPATYLREDTMAALGHAESVPNASKVLIEGRSVLAHLSRGHFANIDLLGQDFLHASRGKVCLDYELDKVELLLG